MVGTFSPGGVREELNESWGYRRFLGEHYRDPERSFQHPQAFSVVRPLQSQSQPLNEETKVTDGRRHQVTGRIDTLIRICFLLRSVILFICAITVRYHFIFRCP